MMYKTESVQLEVNGQKLVGLLYKPTEAGGKLPGVVIYHGRGSSKKRYADRAEELVKAGFITLVFDFRGCGESDGDFSDQTIKMGYEDAEAGYDYLHNLEDVDKNRIGVWGGSFGGFQAALIPSNKKVKALILAAPALYKNEWWEVVPESLIDGAVQQYRDGSNFYDNKAINAMSEYKGSVLLIQHENDEVCPRIQTNAFLDSATNASQTKRHVILGLGHRLDKPEHRQESNQVTVSWFKETL